jgi:hypothetical protein
MQNNFYARILYIVNKGKTQKEREEISPFMDNFFNPKKFLQ